MTNPGQSQIEILNERRIASVVTIRPDGTLHMTAVWFLFDGDAFYIAIPSSSGKARNLSTNKQVALMIDSRVPAKEAGISVSGTAEILKGDAAREVVRRVHAKYLTEEALADEDVGPRFEAVDDIAVRLVPNRWMSWDMHALDQLAFGGRLGTNSYLRPLEP